MEWEAVGIVLAASPFGEADAVITLLTRDHGAHRGLARGARSRGPNRSLWETGNILRVRWVGRLSDQLGSYTGEALRSPAAALFDDPVRMAALGSACAVAAGALPERAAYPRTYDGLVGLLAGLARREAGLASVVRWETGLLEELGYGLDLSRCVVTGAVEDLCFVSPRSGCAVSGAGAGVWRERLLRLPPFMLSDQADLEIDDRDCQDGLAVTGHFLGRDAFGSRHRPMPPLRDRLADLAVRASSREGGVGK